MGNSERKGNPGRPRCRWEDNVKECLQERGWEELKRLIWLKELTGGIF